MPIDLYTTRGCPIDQQRFTWRDMVSRPISKLDDDAFTRVRVILLNGIETDALRFQHAAARRNRDIRLQLAQIRRVEQHQATMVNWLIGADHSPLETTIAYEQVAIEVTADLALKEPDPYLAQAYRFGLLEDFDHLYRYSALLDRLEGKDANNILQSYTDIIPGRPTVDEHRAPEDDLRNPYDRDAALATKLNAMTLTAAEFQTHDYYMNIGPLFADPVARQLYAEIASIEEQHVTQYGSLINPDESWMEQWLLHEAMEVWNYHSAMEAETNHHVKAIWERFLDYELGHFQYVAELFKQVEGRDPAELIPGPLPDAMSFQSHRDFIRQVLAQEVGLRAKGTQFVDKSLESQASLDYRKHINSAGSPSETVASGYQWSPGTELNRKVVVAV